jgi:phospholipase/carboxylesterase
MISQCPGASNRKEPNRAGLAWDPLAEVQGWQTACASVESPRMLDTKFLAAETKSHRLFIALHGLGDSTAGYTWLPEALGFPWMNYLLVNAPDPYYGGFSWYDFSGNENAGIQRSRQLLFALLEAQRASGFPTEQTVLFGFSQGCLMTVDVGLRYPHLFAGLVGVSGYVYRPELLEQELSPVAKQQRMLFTHGTEDSLIPFAQVREQVQRLQRAGLQIEWHEFRKAHTIAGEEELSLIRAFINRCYAAA